MFASSVIPSLVLGIVIVIVSIIPYRYADACSQMFPDGIRVQSLNVVEPRNNPKRRMAIAAQVTLFNANTYESTSKDARINLRTGKVTKAKSSGKTNANYVPKSEPNVPNDKYELEYNKRTSEFELSLPEGSSPITFSAPDYSPGMGWVTYQFFVDSNLNRAYVFYRPTSSSSSSTKVVVLNLENGNVVRRQNLKDGGGMA